MIIDQAGDYESDVVTTVVGQIFGDIESAHLARQANAKLEGRLSSMLSSEDRLVHEVLDYTASWFHVEDNSKTFSVPTSVSSEVNHVCKRFATVKTTHGWMTLSILAHSESFRNACRTFDGPLWDQLMHDIGQNHVSLELFFKVRGLDWVAPLRSVAHLISEQELQSYLQRQEKRELPDIYLQTPHSYVVPTVDGILQRPHYEGVLHLNISSSKHDSKAFAEDPSIRIQNDGLCGSCGRGFCDCETFNCDKITRPLTELIHCSANKGIGVRTLQHIKEGQVLDEYVGELKRASTVVDQSYAMELEGLPAGHRSRNDNDPILIDAQVYGNWTRYINASCNPSLKFVAARIGGKQRMMVVAIRDIKTFEELTIGYGDNYWLGSDTKMCLCNEATCRHASMAQKEKARWNCDVASQNHQSLNARRRVVNEMNVDSMDIDDENPYTGFGNGNARKFDSQRHKGKKGKSSSYPDPCAQGQSAPLKHKKHNDWNTHHAGSERVKSHFATTIEAGQGWQGFGSKRNIPGCVSPIQR
ncbi:MAG: hypothetical protein Q9172_005154 [Xanthocarpia lactea]